MKIGVLTTHPIQYQVPWFRALHQTPGIDLKVFFCMIPDEVQQGEGFGARFQWDVPLLDGYDYEVLENIAPSPSPGHFRGCDTPSIAGHVKHGGFDAFIVNGWVVKSCLQVLWACRRAGVPCIVRGEANNIRRRALWKRLGHRILCRQYSACLCIGEANRQFYLDSGGWAERLFMAPYCVEGDRFAMAAQELQSTRQDLCKEWNIPDDAIVFLTVGKFIAKKRPKDVLWALQVIRSRDQIGRIHVLMAGSGEELAACQAFASEQDLPVSFTGFLNQSEIAKAYAVADCQILPSDNGETWGLVINEGMACGLPAIVSDQVGCAPDLVQPGKTGAIFPMGDVAALADRMVMLASDPDRLGQMGQAAHAHVADYNYDRVVAGTIDAVEYVTRHGR